MTTSFTPRMGNLLRRILSFAKNETRVSTAPLTLTRRAGLKHRDSALESRVREILDPVAPKLSQLISVGWNPRMRTTAGVAIAARWEIWLNPALKQISEKEIDRTLVHELAHLLAQYRQGRRRISPHGAEWRQACRELGIPGERRTHQLPFEEKRMKRRYLLQCPKCGLSHQRVRLPRASVACFSCCRQYHGGRYHRLYRFNVVKIA